MANFATLQSFEQRASESSLELQVTWSCLPLGNYLRLTASDHLTIMAATAGDYAGPRLAPAAWHLLPSSSSIGHFIGSVGTLHLWTTCSVEFITAPVAVGYAAVHGGTRHVP